MIKTWIGVAAALLVVQAPGFAQENGHSGSRPAPRNGAGGDTRGAVTRPAADLEAALTALRKAPTQQAAALAARDVYNLGDAARRALLDVVREKGLSEAAFEGIVGTFEYVRDRAILSAMVDAFGAADATRDRYLGDRFRAFDAQRSMFEDTIADLDAAPPGVRRRALLGVLGEIIDTPVKRMQAARFLVQASQRSEFKDDAEPVRAALQRITFHDYAQPALWQKWFDAFASGHPEGFAEGDLFASALRDRDQRFVTEVKRAISASIAAKLIPPDCFDASRYPEAAIRAYAAQELAGLKEADPELVRQAARSLLDALRPDKTEKDEEVLAAIFRSVGALAEGRDDLKSQAASVLPRFLKDERDGVVIAALKAIAQTGTGSDCHVIDDLYSAAAFARKDRSVVRSQVVTTLYSLDCGSPVIVAALEDTSADVRAAAARGLGYGKRTESASQIAKALRGEKNDEAQRVMARSLVALQRYTPDVVLVLLEVAGKPCAARDAAVRGLIQAGSAGSVTGANAEALVNVLCDALPALATPPEKRKGVLDDLQGAKGPLLTRVLVTWLESEQQPDAARDIAAALARVAPTDPEDLQSWARPLLADGRAAAAAVLLRAAIDAAGGGDSQPARSSEIRLALARALLVEKTPDGLKAAEAIASRELDSKPGDGQLLMLRASIRDAQNRKFEAAEDMRRALRTDGVVMTDPERRDAERRTALLLLTEDPRKAKEFLDALPPAPHDREFLIVLGRVELACGERKAAVLHLRSALDAAGKESLTVVRYHLARALLPSWRADDLIEAKSLFDALDADPALPEGHPLQPLRADLASVESARLAVRDLDDSSLDPVKTLATVTMLGDRSLPWLLHDFGSLARKSPIPTLERRLAALQSIISSDSAASRSLISLSPPSNGSPRDSWLDFAPRLADWFDKVR